MSTEEMHVPTDLHRLERIESAAFASVSRGFFSHTIPSLWLPSPEFWNLPKEPIETPRDKLGLIDIDELIVAVKETVTPDFNWSSPDSTHHFYWPSADYLYDTAWTKGRKKFNESSFRELPIHKGELPRVFENWLHIVTLPPTKPPREVMEYRMEGYHAAKSLFHSVREVIKWMKRSDRRAQDIANNVIRSADNNEYAEEYVANIIAKHFKGVEQHTKALEQVPPEFRLIEPTSSPHELAKNLGKFVTKRSMKLGRKVYQPTAA